VGSGLLRDAQAEWVGRVKEQLSFGCDVGRSGNGWNQACAFQRDGAGEDGAEDTFLTPECPKLELAVGDEAGEFGAGAGAAGGAVVGFAGAEDEVAAVIGGVVGDGEELDVVDFGAVCAGDAACGESLAEGPGEGG